MSKDTKDGYVAWNDAYGPMIDKILKDSVTSRLKSYILPPLTKKELKEIILDPKELMNNRKEYFTEMYLKCHTKLGKAIEKASNG